MKILANTSLIYLCIVYAISLYQWVFIVHRINLYGGLFSVAIFNRRFKISRALYSVVIGGTFSVNLVLAAVEAWKPEIGISNALAQTILTEISALLLCFIIVGSILIRRLRSYFQDNYNK